MKGTKRQKEAIRYLFDTKTKEIVYGGAAGGGKSWLGCFWLMFMASNYPDTRYFIGREELKRITMSTLITWRKVCKVYGVKNWTINHQYNYIELSNGSRIDLLDLKYQPRDPEYERFGSTEYTGGWIEEGGEVHHGAKDILMTRTGRHMNNVYGLISKLFITCNPKKNWLYHDYYKPFKAGTLKASAVFLQALVTDNKYLTEDYIDNLENIRDKTKKMRLLLGEWEYVNDPTILIDYDASVDIFTNSGVPVGDNYITADIARFGNDKTVIFAWSGWRVIDMRIIERSDLNRVKEAIMLLRIKYAVGLSKIIVDEIGVGAGVMDSLGCSGFTASSSEIKLKKGDRKFANLRSQCYFYLVERVNSSKVFIIDTDYKDQIIEELGSIKTKSLTDDSVNAIISKDDMKTTLAGKSPDFADALMMRSYFDLKPTYGLEL